MKKNKELWKCYKCGEFETKADFPKCPKCKSRTCYFIKIIGNQNRKIKFRVWDNFKKKLFFPDQDIKEGILEQVKGFVYMQFTGIYDNTKWEDLTQYEQQLFRISLRTEFGDEAKKKWKGKEIYRGDIVMLLCDGEKIICEVEQRETYYALDGGILGAGDLMTENIKVIGNIYENPELLEGKE